VNRHVRDNASQIYVLRLYVTGATPASARAIANLREICERRLHGRYELQVIDVFQQPGLAAREQILAAPTLLKQLPPPLRRFVGDLSGLEEKLFGVKVESLG
jgi:circadian clock protein KaiB